MEIEAEKPLVDIRNSVDKAAQHISAQDVNSSFAFNSLNLSPKGKLFNSYFCNKYMAGVAQWLVHSAVDAKQGNSTRETRVRFPALASYVHCRHL